MIHCIKRSCRKHVILSLTFLLFLIGSNSFFSTQAFAQQQAKPVKNSYTIIPATNNDILLNPGKGWVVYGMPTEQTAKTIANASVGYTRYNWSQIEPEEGKYNWAIIDKNLAAWKAVGKLFAFGIMNANTSDPLYTYVTPAWVFQDGAASVKIQTYSDISGREIAQYIPVWDDPIFLHKLQDFLIALGHRYDGNPEIAYIDIRSYGNWGVQNVNDLPHSVALTPAGVQTHIQLYQNAFKHTQLLIPWGSIAYKNVYINAVNHHIGIRRDGIMADTTGSEAALAYGKAPVVFEFYKSYQALKQKGFWSNSKLLSSINAGKPSYISMGLWYDDAQVMLTEQPQLIRSLANKMGYYFILSSATLPITITNKQANMFSFSWKNQGIAYLSLSASVAVALLNTANGVIQKQWLTKVNPQNWEPAKTTLTSTPITFTGIQKGQYKLVVGLFLQKTDSNPTYLIGNQGHTSNNWYVLANNISVH
jgi:Domain of unknown function (DUF4832)/Beta-galactosidase